MQIRLLFALQLLLLSGLSAQNYYTVKFPDDQTIYSCGGNPPVVQPVITQYGCNFNVGVAMSDQVFYTNANHTCKKILRKWTLVYWCDYNPNWPAPYYILNPTNTDIGPTVIGNAQNHGYLSYTQVIKVVDNVPPVFLNCPTQPVVFCDYTGNDPAQFNNGWADRCEGPVDLQVKVTDVCSKADILLSYRLYLDLDGNGSMETFISSSTAGAYPIEKTVVGDTLTGKIKFPTGAGLPYGKHKVEWIANDNCAGEALCKYEFTVKDCKAPTVVCINGLSINIMQTGMITLWDTDFLQYTFDNCTPTNQIKIAIRKAGQGTGFPLDQHSVTFDCSELGTQLVEIWGLDSYGNADYCLTYVIVQDNMGSCPNQVQSLPTGMVLTDQSSAVPGVAMQVKNNATPPAVMAQAITSATGQYAFSGSLPVGNYTLKPKRDTLPLSGVNTMDALLLASHVLNIQPITSPYRIIAADIDHNNVLNNDDVAGMVQLVTGQTAAFPNNTAWRFVAKDFVFPANVNPLSLPFPEQSVVGSAPVLHFTAMKTGDIDGSVTTNLAGPGDDREPEILVDFVAPDLSYLAGETVKVEIRTPDMFSLAAFQFTLAYNLQGLQLQSIQPGLVPTAQIGHQPAKGTVAASWYSAVVLAGASWGNQRFVAFTLYFKALQNGDLKNNLSMNALVAKPEAYDNQLKTLPAVLEFEPVPAAQGRAILHPVQPNPASDQFTASYFMPENGEATLRLMDAAGQVVWSATEISCEGECQTVVDLGGRINAGLLFLHLETPFGTGVQKVVVNR